MGFELKKYQDLKIIQALSFLAIPAILWIHQGERFQSISAYVYDSPMVFSFLLTLAGTLFFTNGYTNRANYFEMIIGAALWGVVLTPHLDYPVIHYVFAGIFFFGSVFDIIYFTSPQYKLVAWFFGAAITWAMIGSFVFNWYSIFWAEWIGMIPISLNYYLQTKGIID